MIQLTTLKRFTKTFYMISMIMYFPIYGQSQTAMINITLQNTNKIRVDRRSSIFKRPTNYILEKTDEAHYILKYFGKQPDILTFNFRDIFINPGDQVSLTYIFNSRIDGNIKDSLIATGSNYSNYLFSNARKAKQIDNPYPNEDDSKYKNNLGAFYADVVKFHKSFDDFYGSRREKIGPDKRLLDYLKREGHLQFLMNLMYFSGEFYKQKNPQLPLFLEKFDSDFKHTKFIPTDTIYGCKMEDAFRAYLYHLVHTKFGGTSTKNNFTKLYLEIKQYPTLFVKEYLLYFLLTDSKDLVVKYRPQDIQSEIKKIQNPSIITALRDVPYD